MAIADAEWDRFASLSAKNQVNAMERITHPTASHPDSQYNFDSTEPAFLKFPSYLRRAAIMDALGAVSSYKTRLSMWEKSKQGKAPSLPKTLHTCPALCKGNMYVRTGDYTAKIKVWRNNDWDGCQFHCASLMQIILNIIVHLPKNVHQLCRSVAKTGL